MSDPRRPRRPSASLARLGGLRQKRRGRGVWARGMARADAGEQGALGQPVRARPLKIEFIEEYEYNLAIQRHSLYTKPPVRQLGEIQIALPCEKMGPEARADGRRLASHRRDKPPVRYGWLAVSHIAKTDLPQRLARVRPWKSPGFNAFPLTFPLLDEAAEALEDAVEAGRWGWEQLYYRPDSPVPFPFEFSLFLARDSAVPTDPLPPGADTHHRLEAPNGASGLEGALHVQFAFKLRRPPGLKQEECAVTIGRMHINWPVPVVSSELALLGAAAGRLSVDERYRQVVIEGVPARLIWSERGPVRAEVSFRIGIRRPATLQGKREFRGRARVDARGITLSRLRAQYFDAAGYVQSDNCEGNPLISYRSEIHIVWSCVLEESYHGVPLLLERHYTWPAVETVPEPFEEVEASLRERGFEMDAARSLRRAGVEQRWWATRTVDGQPLVLDVLIQQRTRPLHRVSPLVEEGVSPVIVADEMSPTVYDLTLRSYYRGRWEVALEQVQRLEDRLRERLHFRQDS